MDNRPEGLRNAASEGRLDLIKEMLARDHINLLDWRGSALPAAVENGHVDVVTYLLQRGANPGVAINVASSLGSVEMVETLLKHGASVNDKDYEGKTPLHCACEKGQLEMVKVLLAKGACIGAKDISERTPLHHACKNGELDVVAMLISNRAKVNTKDRGGNNPLHRACENGNSAVVQKLLKHRANSHARNKSDMIPLHCACEVGNTEVVEVLMSHGNYSREELNRALFLTSQEGFHEIAEILLTHGARVRNKMNPLYCACVNGQLEVVKVLIAHGANIHERARDGSTPLHIACGACNVDIVEMLLRKGASVFTKDDSGRMPLHYARSKEVIRILMQHDVDVNTTDVKGNTALVYMYDSELCCTLLDYGAGAGLKCRKLGCLREKTGLMCHYMFCRNNVKCDCRITGQACVNDSSHKNISLVDSFEQHFIKVKTARMNDKEKAVEPPVARVDWSESQRQAYTNICESELRKMKSQIIANTRVTYYDLLTRNLFDLQGEAILGNFDLNECLDNFPIFGDMIHNSYLNFRKAFLKNHSRTFFGLTEPWLPIECAERVIYYLSNRDLDVLVKLCHT